LVIELPEDALEIFVSDSYVGGDPGCDGFESAPGSKPLLLASTAL
jgi:hypothetical protein